MLIAKRILRILFFTEAAVATLLYVMIAALLGTDVIMREVGGTSLMGVQRLCVYAMIQTGFLGLGLAAARGMHLRPRFADGMVPDRYVPIVRRIASFLMAAIFGYFAIFGIEFVMESINYGEMTRSITFPIWIVQLVVPYSLISISLRYLLYGAFPELNPEETIQ